MRVFVFILLALSVSCIDRLDYKIGDINKRILVVDGFISDQAGPYTIKLFQSLQADGDLRGQQPFLAKEVSIWDDVGNREILKAVKPGIYVTSENGIRGQIGRTYWLKIITSTDVIFQSTPEEIIPVDDIDAIHFEWVSSTPLDAPTTYGFKIYMDSNVSSDQRTYLRWRYSGTYMGEAFPKLHSLYDACPGYPDPLPCSGYVFGGFGIGLQNPGGKECSCCYCWITDTEDKPHLNDDKIMISGEYKNVEVGYVPFNEWTFRFFKYMVKVEQMSLSEDAYQFWKIIRDQKEGLSSLFQPAFGKVKTNLYSVNPDARVAGIFYATSIKQKVLFLKASDAKLPVPTPDIPPETSCFFAKACDDVWVNASRTPPPEWK